MALEDVIQRDLIAAMKEKDDLKISTLKLIKTEILNAKKAPGFDENKFDDDAVKNIMRDMCKERDKTSEIAMSNGRTEFAEKELAEKKIISNYLPKQATEKEVEAIVKSVICELGASSMKDMGKVMNAVKSELGDKSDGKTISTIVKICLNNK